MSVIETNCRICGNPVTVNEPDDFQAFCETSAMVRNREIDAELAVRKARQWRHDAPGRVGPTVLGSIVPIDLPPLQKATSDDVRQAWIKTLCHTRCYDRRDKRKRLESRMASAMVVVKRDPKQWTVGSAMRTALERICKDWCVCVSADLGDCVGVNWGEMADGLIEFPDELQTVLSTAREFIRNHVQREL